MKSISKSETENLNIEVEFARVLEYTWRAGTSYSLTDYVRPDAPNGFEYECTNAGQSASIEPEFPTTIGATIDDGSVEWTCRDFGTNGTDTISSQSVAAETGLTISNASATSTVVAFNASGGTNGNAYVVSVEATTAGGKVFEQKLKIVIRGD